MSHVTDVMVLFCSDNFVKGYQYTKEACSRLQGIEVQHTRRYICKRLQWRGRLPWENRILSRVTDCIARCRKLIISWALVSSDPRRTEASGLSLATIKGSSLPKLAAMPYFQISRH